METTVRPGVAVRDAIVDAATELIRTQGVVGTSISDLIAKSGTSAGAIYHHFGSKQGVVLEVARRVIAIPMAMVLRTPSAAGLSPSSLLKAALAHVSRDDATSAMLVQIWAGAMADPELAELLHDEAIGLKNAVSVVVAAWCAAQPRQIDSQAMTELLMGLVLGYAVQRSLIPGGDPEGYLTLAEKMLAQFEQPER